MRQTELVRLARILGMLGSEHPGERASAALAAHRLVKGAGCSWWELLSPAKVAPRPARSRSFVDVFHDPVAAANSRMRQLRRENEALQRDLDRLKRELQARRAADASLPHRRGRSLGRR
jgi:hypothetical protein